MAVIGRSPIRSIPLDFSSSTRINTRHIANYAHREYQFFFESISTIDNHHVKFFRFFHSRIDYNTFRQTIHESSYVYAYLPSHKYPRTLPPPPQKQTEISSCSPLREQKRGVLLISLIRVQNERRSVITWQKAFSFVATKFLG